MAKLDAARVGVVWPASGMGGGPMPKPKHPRLSSLDGVHITREGDAAIIRYADDSVAVTHFSIGAEKLKGMTDQDVLDLWNRGLEALELHRQGFESVATEVPVGKPQASYFEPGSQWTPRGHVLRCEIITDAAIEPALEEPFVAIDGRDFTLAEFFRMVGSFGGWGMRIEFVPDDELHLRPKLKVQDPDSDR